MPRRTITFVLAVLLYGGADAQVSLDKPLRLTGSGPAQRQITGLQISNEPGAVLTADVEQRGAFRLTAPSAGTTWSAGLSALINAPAAGLHMVVSSPVPTPGSISVVVNGHGPYLLLDGDGQPVDGELIAEGTMLSIVHDGTAFRLLNGGVAPRHPCAPGTVQVNDAYCISENEYPASDFFAAVTTCGDLGLRLCGWGEFVAACQRAGTIGMLDGTNNWEWTNDASNENGSARIVGAGSCLSAGNSIVVNSTLRNFHCCYSR